MIVAVDRVTGKVVGQVVTLDAENDYLRGMVRIVDAIGPRHVPESSVRLEKV